jgi:UDP-2,4-diacetamido-2,4,6-trideoxy-beta-L-altropyranose hydrolase
MVAAVLTFRTATVADRQNIFNWRNHQVIRQCSRELAEIPWAEHCAWFEKILTDPNRLLLIANWEADVLGVLRYDLSDTTALVSIYLIPQKIGQGYGVKVLQAGIQWIQHQYPAIQKLSAEILADNAASIRAFEKAGYLYNQVLSTPELLVYEYHFHAV